MPHNIARFLVLLFLLSSAKAVAGEGKPNFLQILTDDQGWGDLQSYGHVFLKTPHIDRLAEEGIKFTHCYAADSVCSPSRAAILTVYSDFYLRTIFAISNAMKSLCLSS